MWDLIVSVPDHCLSFYFERNVYCLTMKLLQSKRRCTRDIKYRLVSNVHAAFRALYCSLSLSPDLFV